MCSICLIQENNCVNLQDIYKKEYDIKCQCNIKVHKTCVYEWIVLKNTCPICNIELTRKKKMNFLSFIIGLINIFVALISMLIGFITIIDSILFNSNVNIHFLVLIMNRTYSNETRNETNNEIAVNIFQMSLIILSIIFIPTISIIVLWIHHFF